MTCHRRIYAIAALLGRIDSHDKKNHSTEPVPNASRLKWEAEYTNQQSYRLKTNQANAVNDSKE